MSPKNFVSDNNDLTDRASEDRENIDEQSQDNYYADNYTPSRPPNLNDDNFPSTQPSGPYSQSNQVTNVNGLPESVPESVHVTNDTNANYTYGYSPTSTTQMGSTMNASNHFIPHPEVVYYNDRGYQRRDETGQRLTRHAIAILERNQAQSYDGNPYTWMPPLVGHNLYADPDSHSSTGYLAPGGHLSQNPTTSSWVFPPTPEDHSVSNLYAVGSQLEIPADTAWPSNLPDEDMRD
ncbi:hypothetical protein K449DRAFT_392916, partial [Hypoxylon sp. EC38]